MGAIWEQFGSKKSQKKPKKAITGAIWEQIGSDSGAIWEQFLLTHPLAIAMIVKNQSREVIMSIDELRDAICSELKSGNFPLQVIFDRHLETIEELLESGMLHSSIYKELCLSVNFEHYRNLIARSRRKRNKQKKLISKKISTPQVNEVSEVKDTNPFDLDYWNQSLGFEVSDRNLKKLEELGLTPDFILEQEITNARKLTDFLVEFKHLNRYK